MSDSLASEASAVDVLNSTAQTRLRTIVERAERLIAERDDISADLREVFSEAKGEGFDAKILRKVIAWRAKDPGKRQEEESLLDLYLSALGSGLPAGVTIEIGGEPVAIRPTPPPATAQTKLQLAADAEAVAAAIGRQAAQENRPLGANPYDPGSAQARAFADGHRGESLRLSHGRPA